MKPSATWRRFIFILISAILLPSGCKKGSNGAIADHPRLSAQVKMQDVVFHSSALQRDMDYRVILPASISAGKKLPVIYLLHGGGGGFRDWSNYSDLAQIAERGFIVVMPEGNSSYYTNSAGKPQDKYEDYIVQDLILDVEKRFPAAVGRENRAIAGVSMGGYGAIKIALRHPDLFFFSGGLSPAVDVPTRPFSIKRISQWHFHSSIFGPSGSATRRENDPFALAYSADPKIAPYLYFVCGDQEGLLPANRNLAALLTRQQIPSEFHIVRGGHNWTQWSVSAKDMFESLQKNMQPKSIASTK